MQKNIKGYTLIKQIGTGGFGEVYVANQPVINREVAIKVILPLYANRTDFIKKFQFEAELVAKLEHPHIVPLYDYWRDPTGAYLVMRYIKGGNLADHLMTQGPIDMMTAGKILSQIAGALHTAHRNRVIHQDIKPANIMLDEDFNAYLTDFGIARDIEANVNLAEDESNTMHGSPKYISPEHLRRREITPRSDIYSLGILMYELLTGKAPFEHDDMLQLLQMHIRNDLPALQRDNPALPQELNQPLQQATLKDPMSRYDSALKFALDFDTIITQVNQNKTSPLPVPLSDPWELEETGPIEVRNPYKGLNAFKESDANDFYGRDELVNSLIESMKNPDQVGRFMAVVGASGSGKSSVIRAGLIPAVRAEQIEGLPPLYISTMIPGSNPMRSLEGAILKVASRASVSLMQTISRDEYDLNEALKSSLPEDGEMLLLIDQFEELFTQVTDESKRATFLSQIYDALMADDSRLRVIATLRADFLDRPLMYPEWGHLFRERMELIPPMSQAELRSAIEDPAEANGLEFESGLSGMLIADVNSERGVLPLLQYTLRELYERKDGITLTVEAYQDIGRISGALAKRADEIFETLPEDEQEIARLIFMRLIRISDRANHTRQRVLLGELYTLERDQEKIQHVIDTFGKYRLLTFDNETSSRLPTVEIVHEALIRSWDLLRDWIADNADALRLQGRLSDAAKLWVEEGKDSSYLATGLRLQQFKTLDQNDMIVLTKRETEYLVASIQQEDEAIRRAKQRQRVFDVLRVGIFIFGIVAVIAAIIAYRQRNLALDARDAETVARSQAETNAEESRARELAANSLLFAENQPDRAILLALESLAVQDTFEGENALLASLLTQQRLTGYYSAHQSFVRAVATSADGATLATGDQDGTVILWDTTARQLLHTMTQTARINVVAFSPDNTSFLSADGDGHVMIWEVESGEQIADLTLDDEIRGASFSPDGTTVAIANSNGQITWFSTDDYQEIEQVMGHDNGVIYDLAYSADGQFIATGGDDNTIHIWNTDDYSLERIIEGHSNWVLSVEFSPLSNQVASGTLDGNVYLWDANTGDNLWARAGHTAEVFGLTFSDDGALVISGALDDFVIIRDVNTGDALSSFPTFDRTGIRDLADFNNSLYIVGDTHEVIQLTIGFVPRFGTSILTTEEEVLTTAIASDGTLAYAGGETSDFAIYISSEADDTPTTLDFHDNLVTGLVWSGDRLISVSVDRQVAIWENNEVVASFEADDSIFSITSHNDLLALGTNQGIIELWEIADTPTRRTTYDGHDNRISALDFNSDGSQLVSAGRDKGIILWDVESDDPIFDTIAHSDPVEAIAFHPNDSIIASGSRDETVILWDATTGEPLGPALVGHENWVNDLAFNADGTHLISVSADRSIIIWDTEHQRALGIPFIGHTNWVNTISFADSGDYFITGGRGGELFRWQANQSDWEQIACDITNRSLTEGEIRDFFSDAFQPANYCEAR